MTGYPHWKTNVLGSPLTFGLFRSDGLSTIIRISSQRLRSMKIAIALKVEEGLKFASGNASTISPK